MNEFPALNGQTVTERHARICRTSGHAVHNVDGQTSETCPRCGDVLMKDERQMESSLLMHGDRVAYTPTEIRIVDHVTTHTTGEAQSRTVIWFEDGTTWDVPSRARVTLT